MTQPRHSIDPDDILPGDQHKAPYPRPEPSQLREQPANAQVARIQVVVDELVKKVTALEELMTGNVQRRLNGAEGRVSALERAWVELRDSGHHHVNP